MSSNSSENDPRNGTAMRRISPKFMDALNSGILSSLLKRVKEDDTLTLALRGPYINIYYRGGSLFKITECTETYQVEFNKKYYGGCSSLRVDFPSHIGNCTHATRLVDAIPKLKYAMDCFFHTHNRPEREFQQLVVRENNFSSVSPETEYFIADIEVAEATLHAKFDMLAVHWPSDRHGQASALVPALIEMKYGNGALAGKAGLIKHLNDAYLLRNDKEGCENLQKGLEDHLKQLKDLCLLKFNPSPAVPELLLDRKKTAELIFILANYNPRAPASLNILREFNEILEKKDPQDSEEKLFDVRFFNAAFAGYGMHHASMLTSANFLSLAQKLYETSKPVTRTPVVVAVTSATPSVGIFWRVAGDLVIDRSTLDEAETYGDCITHAVGHYERWQEWQALGATQLAAMGYPVRIVSSEYDEWPRGRIVYETLAQRFVIYADGRLQAPGTIDAIKTAFGLGDAEVIVKSDLHYR